MDALITDFDGVMVDSEPLHLRGFSAVLAGAGITLTADAYYSRYLGLDDHDCFQAAARDARVGLSEMQISLMTAAKSAMMQTLMAREIQAFPGVVEMLASLTAADIPLAVCSGALRAEIDLCCEAVGIADCFLAKVTARDVLHGKPDPQGYLMALEQLRELTGRDLRADRCVVFEDSPQGIAAAKDAGMHVVAVTNSYPATALGRADAVVDSLQGISADSLRARLVS